MLLKMIFQYSGVVVTLNIEMNQGPHIRIRKKILLNHFIIIISESKYSKCSFNVHHLFNVGMTIITALLLGIGHWILISYFEIKIASRRSFDYVYLFEFILTFNSHSRHFHYKFNCFFFFWSRYSIWWIW